MKTVSVFVVAFLLAACGGGNSSNDQSQQVRGAQDSSAQIATTQSVSSPVIEDIADAIKVEAASTVVIDPVVHLPDGDTYFNLYLEVEPVYGKATINNNEISYTANPNYGEDSFSFYVRDIHGQVSNSVTVNIEVTYETLALTGLSNSCDVVKHPECTVGEGYPGESAEHWLKRTGQYGLVSARSFNADGHNEDATGQNEWNHSNVGVYKGPTEVNFDTHEVYSYGRCYEKQLDSSSFGGNTAPLKPTSECYDSLTTPRTYLTLSQ